MTPGALPSRPVVRPGDGLGGYLDRLQGIYALDRTQTLRAVGLHDRPGPRWRPDTWRLSERECGAFAAATGLSTTDSRAMTLGGWASRFTGAEAGRLRTQDGVALLAGEGWIHLDAAPVCRICVQARPEARSLLWRLGAAPVCLTHDVVLSDPPNRAWRHQGSDRPGGVSRECWDREGARDAPQAHGRSLAGDERGMAERLFAIYAQALTSEHAATRTALIRALRAVSRTKPGGLPSPEYGPVPPTEGAVGLMPAVIARFEEHLRALRAPVRPYVRVRRTAPAAPTRGPRGPLRQEYALLALPGRMPPLIPLAVYGPHLADLLMDGARAAGIAGPGITTLRRSAAVFLAARVFETSRTDAAARIGAGPRGKSYWTLLASGLRRLDRLQEADWTWEAVVRDWASQPPVDYRARREFVRDGDRAVDLAVSCDVPRRFARVWLAEDYACVDPASVGLSSRDVRLAREIAVAEATLTQAMRAIDEGRAAVA